MDIFYSKIMGISFSLLILVNGLCFYKITGTVRSPAVLISVFWFLLTFFPLVVLWNLPVDARAVGYIFLCILFFSLPALFFRAKSSVVFEGISEFDSKYLLWSLLLFQAVALISVVLQLSYNDFGLLDFFRSLHKESAKYMSMKYSGDIKISIWFKVGTLLNYIAVMIGGLYFSGGISKRVRGLVLMACVLPSACFMLIYGDKGTLFLCVSLFFGAWFAGVTKRGARLSFSKKSLKFVIVGLALFLPILLSSIVARGLYDKAPDVLIRSVLYTLSSYAFGHLYAFGDWFSSFLGSASLVQYEVRNIPPGYLTFKAVLDWFGLGYSLPHGIYTEYFRVDGVLQSNIYSMFRGLITDFGLIGGLVFWFVAGIFSHFSFWCLQRNKMGMLPVVFYIFMCGYLYTSYIVSLLIWNSVIFAAVGLAVLLSVVSWLESRKCGSEI